MRVPREDSLVDGLAPVLFILPHLLELSALLRVLALLFGRVVGLVKLLGLVGFDARLARHYCVGLVKDRLRLDHELVASEGVRWLGLADAQLESHTLLLPASVRAMILFQVHQSALCRRILRQDLLD